MKGQISHIVLVGAGGFAGSVLRYALSGAVHRCLPFSHFPFGTLAVNVIGCGLIGLFAGLADARQVVGPALRLVLFLGVLGGFTTFSTFSLETLALVRDGEPLKAGANVMGSVALCLGGVWAGYAAATFVSGDLGQP